MFASVDEIDCARYANIPVQSYLEQTYTKPMLSTNCIREIPNPFMHTLVINIFVTKQILRFLLLTSNTKHFGWIEQNILRHISKMNSFFLMQLILLNA